MIVSGSSIATTSTCASANPAAGHLLASTADELSRAGRHPVLDDATFKAMNDVDFPVAKVLEGIELVLQPACRVEGAVIGLDGAPVAGARVYAVDEQGKALTTPPEGTPLWAGPAVTADGAKHLRDTATHAVYAVGAGTWSFSAPA